MNATEPIPLEVDEPGRFSYRAYSFEFGDGFRLSCVADNEIVNHPFPILIRSDRTPHLPSWIVKQLRQTADYIEKHEVNCDQRTGSDAV